jgi:hypothetical protein
MQQDIFSLTRHNRLDAVKALLDGGVSDANDRDYAGNTILLVACQNGLKNMAKTSLRRGGDINARNTRGNTALHFAYAYGYGDDLGSYLITKGADPQITNGEGLRCYDVFNNPALMGRRSVVEESHSYMRDKIRQEAERAQGAGSSSTPQVFSFSPTRSNGAQSSTAGTYGGTASANSGDSGAHGAAGAYQRYGAAAGLLSSGGFGASSNFYQGGSTNRASTAHRAGSSTSTTPYAQERREINRGVREVRDDGRTEEERWILAEEMLSEQEPYTIQASPPLPLSYILGSYAVAWRVEGEDGEWQWMPYCAGRRRPGEEEESDF